MAPLPLDTMVAEKTRHHNFTHIFPGAHIVHGAVSTVLRSFYDMRPGRFKSKACLIPRIFWFFYPPPNVHLRPKGSPTPRSVPGLKACSRAREKWWAFRGRDRADRGGTTTSEMKKRAETASTLSGSELDSAAVSPHLRVLAARQSPALFRACQPLAYSRPARTTCPELLTKGVQNAYDKNA